MKKDNTESTVAWRPAWIDWIILLIAAVVVFLAVRYVAEKRTEAQADVSIEYVLCMTEQTISLAEENGGIVSLIPVGASVSNANGSADMGRVIAVESRPHQTLTVKGKQIVMAERAGYVDLYITVRSAAVRREGDGLRVGDIRVAAGSVGDYLIGSFWADNAVTVAVRIG